MSIEFRGLEEIEEYLEGLKATENTVSALKEACLLVRRSAMQNAPKGKTGELARSIKHKVEGLEGIVYSNLEYAPYVEYGTGLFAENGGRQDVPWCYQDEETGDWIYTSGQNPNPYMRPALNMNKERILKLIKESLTK